MCSHNSQISNASKNRAPIHHESAKSLRQGQSLISSHRHGYCDVFFVGKCFLTLLVLGYLTCSQEPRWLRVAWWTQTFYYYTLIHLDNSKPFVVQYWLPWSPESIFAFTTQHVVIEVPERTSDSLEPITLKTFAHKKHIAMSMTRGGDKRLTWP